MITKPNNANKYKSKDNKPISAGGHCCQIRNVEETVSKSGNKMLIVEFDTDEKDTQPFYFRKKYEENSNYWQGKKYVVLEGQYGEANLMRFVTAVEDSNDGFRAWDEFDHLRIPAFEGKKVGVIFRAEQYEKRDGSGFGLSAKPWLFCDYKKAKDEKAPKVKLKENPADGFVATEETSIGSGMLPFN